MNLKFPAFRKIVLFLKFHVFLFDGTQLKKLVASVYIADQSFREKAACRTIAIRQKYFLHESASNIESDDYFVLPSGFKMASLAATLFSKKATGIANYTVSVQLEINEMRV